MLFVTPVKGAKVVQAAQAAGFTKPENIHSATGIGSKFVSYVALDTAEDAAKSFQGIRCPQE